MRILLVVAFLFFLRTSNANAQKVAIEIDILKSILQNTERKSKSWVYCQNIDNLFKSDTLIIHSVESTGRLPIFCASDTISIINFGDQTALISEKSKSEDGIHETFSTLNKYQTVFKKKSKSAILVFKNYDHIYTYRLIELKKNSLNYIIILVKRKNFR